MKTLLIVLLCCSLSASSFAQTLPDAPSATVKSWPNADAFTCSWDGPCYPAPPRPRQSFSKRHETAIVWSILGSGLLTGLFLGLATRGVTCSATTYDGHPYHGTSPGCPKPETH